MANDLTPKTVSLSPNDSDNHSDPSITKSPPGNISSASYMSPSQIEKWREMVINKRKRNQEILKSLGLDTPPKRPSQLRNDKKKMKPKKKRPELRKSTQENSRMSRRQRQSHRHLKQPAQYTCIDDIDRPVKKPKLVLRVSQQRQSLPPPAPTPLTNERRDALSRAEKDWLSLFYEFLLTVPHGTSHKTVSKANAQLVMNKVRLLVSGTGVTYRRWEEGVAFCKGRKISLGDDFDALYEEAQKFEDLHGRDLGNGWLLKHPIEKLRSYQAYRASKGIK